jgi:rubrerythrin
MSDYDKPSRAEDEYFAKQELERRKQWAKEKEKKMAAEEKERRKQEHWMKCPKCGMDLTSIVFQGVTIDQCPSCGGTFLDAGELQQLLQADQGFVHKVLSIFR